MKPRTRILLTLGAGVACWAANWLLRPASTVISGDVAGLQFSNSNVAYVGANAAMALFGHLGIPLLVLLVVILAIWWKPLRTFWGAFALLLVSAGLHPAAAYYEKADYAEAYTILPNESAFWIPDAGNNKDSQAQFDSEQYFNANRVALKRFVVPHVHMQGSGTFFDYYVPAGRLLVVDRTPYSREWVDAHDRGTSVKKEGFPCQTKEGLNVTLGISIGASVLEQNAAKYLYRFGVVAPAGNRNDPQVIFASVFYSRKLADVMDDVGRKKVQTLVCGQIASRSFDQANADTNAVMDAVRTAAADYFASVGITLDFVGWADTFTFDPEVQAAVNRRYIASQDKAVAEALAPYADTIQKLAAADALRAFGSRSDGKLPTTIVGLPADVRNLLSTLLGAGVAGHDGGPTPGK